MGGRWEFNWCTKTQKIWLWQYLSCKKEILCISTKCNGRTLLKKKTKNLIIYIIYIYIKFYKYRLTLICFSFESIGSVSK